MNSGAKTIFWTFQMNWLFSSVFGFVNYTMRFAILVMNTFFFTGLLSWNLLDCHVDLEDELNNLTNHAPEGEAARHGNYLQSHDWMLCGIQETICIRRMQTTFSINDGFTLRFVLLSPFWTGERLIQFASENLVTEILIHPQYNTLIQCMRNLLSSFTRHRHIIHSGYTFSGNGSWILQVSWILNNLFDFARWSVQYS